MNRELNIGIIGGCLMNQRGIKPAERFRRLLADQLKSSGIADVTYSGRIYRSIDGEAEKGLTRLARKTLESSSPDIMILQIRNIPFISEIKVAGKLRKRRRNVVAQVRKGGGQVRSSSKPLAAVARFGITAVGLILGRYASARRRITEGMLDISRACSDHDCTLIVLGPFENPMAPLDSWLFRRLDAHLSRVAGVNNVRYLSCLSQLQKTGGSSYVFGDFHLTPEGHSIISRMIGDELRSLSVREIRADRMPASGH